MDTEKQNNPIISLTIVTFLSGWINEFSSSQNFIPNNHKTWNFKTDTGNLKKKKKKKNQIFGHRNKNKKKPMIPYSSKLSTENPKHEIHSHPQSIY